MSDLAIDRSALLRRFADEQFVALSKLAIETAFQPIVEISTGHVFGFESLMRGHEKLGFNSPLDLIDHAADLGKTLPLEQILLGRAIATFAAMPSERSQLLFVNFDTRLISDSDAIIDLLLQRLNLVGVPPSSVCLELSERFDNLREPGIRAFIARLDKLGFRLAIDDFGVGHGEIRLLDEVAVDFMKIDRAFISGIDASPRKRHIVRNLVRLAHALSVRVVAEGVETESELAMCRELGCDLVQGWYVARPTTAITDLRTHYAHIAPSGGAPLSAVSFDQVLIGRQIETLPTLRDSDPVDRVFDLFKAHPSSSYFPVIDAQDMPVGIVHERTLKGVIYHPYGRDLLRNKIYKRGIADFLMPTPIAALQSDAERLLEAYSTMEGCDCLILTDQMRYAGVLSASSLLKIINDKKLRTAEDQNPLTGLPGNRSIRDYVHRAALDGDVARYLCYCDFDHFKPFNDRYGFQQGDAAITMFAALLRRRFVGDLAFVGHVGGDDFFLGLADEPLDSVLATIAELIRDFGETVLSLYSDKDRAAGQFIAPDRAGLPRTFQLMRCSVAVLHLPAGVVTGDTESLVRQIAGLKSKAKADASGIALAVFGGDC